VALTFEDLIPLLDTVKSYLFLKTFQVVPSISIGTLILPPYETKSAANTRENSLVYFVIQGLVNITVNGHSFTAAKASHFMILRGLVSRFEKTSYSILILI
jgi:Mif2/CENP-C like